MTRLLYSLVEQVKMLLTRWMMTVTCWHFIWSMFRMEKSELEKELLVQAPIEWQRFQSNKKKKSRGKSNFQRTMEDAERRADELRQKYRIDSPALREIEQKMRERINPEGTSNLVCPRCKEDDRGNRMNKQPWCMKCGTSLVSRKKLKKGRRQHEIRHVRNPMRHESDRLNSGLNPKNNLDDI